MRFLLFFGISIGFILLFFGMDPLLAQTTYRLESEIVGGSGDHTPFWLVNNRHGLSSLETPNGYVKVGLKNEYDLNKSVDYRVGLDVVKAQNYTSNYILQQAYLDLRFKKFELSMGAKEYNSILKNQRLSSGGMTWSGNARPIPMVRLNTNDYISFPWLLHNRLKLKGSMAFGWFTDGDFQAKNVVFDSQNTNSSFVNFYNRKVIYHQKMMTADYAFKNSPWAITIALQMDMQFSGDKYSMKNGVLTMEHTSPSFKHYMMALIPSSGDKGSATGDQQYVFGNTLGSEHIMLHYSNPEYEWKVYLENFFEDFGGMAKQNRLDGLWGLEYESKINKGITGVVVEYLQTSDQSGPIHWAPSDYPTAKLRDQATGNDDYYNNFYYTGWEHWGMTNGNPLISSPIYNSNGSLRMMNNRVKSIHLGMSAAITSELEGRFLGTVSRGWGRHYLPFEETKDSQSMLVELNYSPKRWGGWKFTASGAMDRGDLYGDNSAFSFKISKTGTITK
ncbi:MAG: capsule assembly Wzi family protein [Bacteroidales bacterium]|nr:capsule assembly Wzi family protein [Bacteroidales bacterium]